MPIDEWQCDIIRRVLECRLTDLKEVFVKGCTKAGKGFAVATAAVLWYQSRKESCRIIVTSDSAEHAKKVMMAEVIRQREGMRFACEGTNSREAVFTNHTKYIKVANPENAESFRGQHSEATLFLFDEASSISEVFFDLAGTQAAGIAVLSNPSNSRGWFRRAFPNSSPDLNQVITIPGGRRSLHTVGGKDCINVRSGEHVITAQIDAERYEAIMAKGVKWGRVFGDGKFPLEGDDDVIISGAWLEHHIRAWHADLPVIAFGLDVAASVEGDQSILTAGGADGIRKLHVLQTADTMKVVAWVLRTVETVYGANLKDGQYPVVVDMDGLGKGVGDRLTEQGVLVVEFRGNARSEVDPKTYRNLRAEGYGELGERLNPEGPFSDKPYGLPDDSVMLEEICAPEKVYASDGVSYNITPKRATSAKYRGDTISKILGRSPDRGDSVVYCYHGVRYALKLLKWGESWSGELLASGEDPVEEHRRMDEDEVGELEPWLKEIVEASRDRSGFWEGRNLNDDIFRLNE
jgi:hypothetical protein